MDIPKPIEAICRVLRADGYQAYLVGGAVRDSLMGKTPKDYDIVTDSLPHVVEGIFPQSIATGKRFGTITVRSEGTSVEVTTMRRDGTYSDQRHPDTVEYTKELKEDLARRDFTINAIAYSPFEGKFFDPFFGIRDIKRKQIRSVGCPRERFSEDPLRILRCLRFSATLGFSILAETLEAINPSTLDVVSLERIRDEFSKLLLAEDNLPTLELLFTTGVLKQILPELVAGHGIRQGGNHKWDVLGHSLVTASVITPSLHLRLAGLLHDVGKSKTYLETDDGLQFHQHHKVGAEETRTILRRLRYSNQEVERVAHLVENHMFNLHPESTDRAIRRLLARVGADHILDLLELRRADILAQRFHAPSALAYGQALAHRVQEILQDGSALSLSDLSVRGDDLVSTLNIPPGKKIGEILSYLLEQVLEEPHLNTRSRLLKLAEYYVKENERA